MIIKNNTIDQILECYKSELGKSFEAYRNHVYRVFNFSIPSLSTQDEINTLAIAVAFHDLGIWTHKTFDYLNPSIDLANKYCDEQVISQETSNEIKIIINLHHKLSKINTSTLAEIFRQADLVDLSLGIVRNNKKWNEIKLVKKTFPNKGFHLYLTLLFFKNLLKKPWNPFPMYKL